MRCCVRVRCDNHRARECIELLPDHFHYISICSGTAKLLKPIKVHLEDLTLSFDEKNLEYHSQDDEDAGDIALDLSYKTIKSFIETTKNVNVSENPQPKDLLVDTPIFRMVNGVRINLDLPKENGLMNLTKHTDLIQKFLNLEFK